MKPIGKPTVTPSGRECPTCHGPLFDCAVMVADRLLVGGMGLSEWSGCAACEYKSRAMVTAAGSDEALSAEDREAMRVFREHTTAFREDPLPEKVVQQLQRTKMGRKLLAVYDNMGKFAPGGTAYIRDK